MFGLVPVDNDSRWKRIGRHAIQPDLDVFSPWRVYARNASLGIEDKGLDALVRGHFIECPFKAELGVLIDEYPRARRSGDIALLNKFIGNAEGALQFISAPWFNLLVGDAFLRIGSLAGDDRAALDQLKKAKERIARYLSVAGLSAAGFSQGRILLSRVEAMMARRSSPGPDSVFHCLEAILHQYRAVQDVKRIDPCAFSEGLPPPTGESKEAFYNDQLRYVTRGLGIHLVDFGNYMEAFPVSRLGEVSQALRADQRFLRFLPRELSFLADPSLYAISRVSSLLSVSFLNGYLVHCDSSTEIGDHFSLYHRGKALLGLGKAQVRQVHQARFGQHLIGRSIECFRSLDRRFKDDQNFVWHVNFYLGQAFLSRSRRERRLDDAFAAIHCLENHIPRGKQRISDGNFGFALDAHLLIAGAYRQIGDLTRRSSDLRLPVGEEPHLPLWFNPDDRLFSADLSYRLALGHIDEAVQLGGNSSDASLLRMEVLLTMLDQRVRELGMVKGQVDMLVENKDNFRFSLILRMLESLITHPKRRDLCLPLIERVRDGSALGAQGLFSDLMGFELRQARLALDDLWSEYEVALEIDRDDPRPDILMLDAVRLLSEQYPMHHKVFYARGALEDAIVEKIARQKPLSSSRWMTRSRHQGGFFNERFYVKIGEMNSCLLLESLVELKRRDALYSSLALPRVFLSKRSDGFLMLEVTGKDLPTLFDDRLLEQMIYRVAERSQNPQMISCWEDGSKPHSRLARRILRPWVDQWVLVASAFERIMPSLSSMVLCDRFNNSDDYSVRAAKSISRIALSFEGVGGEEGRRVCLQLYRDHVAPVLSAMPRAYYKDHNGSNCTQNRQSAGEEGFSMALIDFGNVKHSHYVEDLVALLVYEGTPSSDHDMLMLSIYAWSCWSNADPRLGLKRPGPREWIRPGSGSRAPADSRRASRALFLHDVLYATVDKLLHMVEHKQEALEEIPVRCGSDAERYMVETFTLHAQKGYWDRLVRILRFGSGPECSFTSPAEKEGLGALYGLLSRAHLDNDPRYAKPLTSVDPKELLSRVSFIE